MTTVTVTTLKQSLKQDLTTRKQDLTTSLSQISFDIWKDIELDDLERIMTIEFPQGLPSDTVINLL